MDADETDPEGDPDPGEDPEPTQDQPTTSNPQPSHNCPKCDAAFKTLWRYDRHVANPTGGCQKVQAQRARAKPVTQIWSPDPEASLPTRLSKLRTATHLPDHIPKKCRKQVAREFIKVLQAVTQENSVESWTNLLTFAFRVLGQPKSARANRKRSLPQIILQNLRGNTACETDEPVKPTRSLKETAGSAIAKRIYRKMQDGDVSGAVRLLSSEETILPPCMETTEALREKHPAGAPVQVTAPGKDHVKPPSITAKEVRAAITGFPNGSAAGPDGMRPGYFKELLGILRGVDETQFCELLATVGDTMLAGTVPEGVRPILYGANLFAFRKKGGGVRPIAVGVAMRRLVARLVSRRLNPLGELMRPTQLGFATKGGAEAAVHAARSFLERNKDNPVTRALVKLDVKNAFNSLDRTKLLEAVQEKMPGYLPLFFQSYGAPTVLLSGPDVIQSERGLQQGDPLGPVGYCATTHDAHQDLKSELVIGFLDDDVLAGDVDQVISDILRLRSDYEQLGLEMNITKCELYLVGGDKESRSAARRTVLDQVGEMVCPTAEELTYLGSPLTTEALTTAMESHIATAERLIKSTEVLNAHTALYLLLNCLGPAKVLYTLRTSRVYQVPALLQKFDQLMAGKLSSFANVCITDAAFEQLSLPMSLAGLGIRRVEELALPAFLDSAYSVLTLVAAMGPIEVEQYTQSAAVMWTTHSESEIPPEPLRKDQKSWDNPIASKRFQHLKEMTAVDPTSKARLLAATTPESSDWLRSLPAFTIGTVLDDHAIQNAIALRLGLEVCKPHECVCGQWADAHGHHAMVCAKSPGRLRCHASLNETVARTLQSAGFCTELEPLGLSDLDNKRPDGQTISPWSGGRRLAWDATVSSTTAVSHIVGTSTKAGSAADHAEQRKIDHYVDLTPSIIFEPLSFETLGSWGTRTIKTISEIGKRLQQATGEKRATEFFRQRLSIEIQRGNSQRILGTQKERDDLDEMFSVLRPMRKKHNN